MNNPTLHNNKTQISGNPWDNLEGIYEKQKEEINKFYEEKFGGTLSK